LVTQTRQYEHLIKPLSTGDLLKAGVTPGQSIFTSKPGIAAQTIRMNGQEHLEGLDLSFTWSVHNEIGAWQTNPALHVHPYPEVHWYVGLDTANVNYLGAEIEVCLGEEQERYLFSEPTVVVIPAGLPHGPTVTKRMYSPKGFGFYLAALGSSFQKKLVDAPAGPATSNGKYAHLVKPLKPAILIERRKLNMARGTTAEAGAGGNGNPPRMTLGPGNADHLAWMYGSDLEGLNVNMDWGFFSSPGLWHRGVGAHVHPVGEVLVFVGMDPTNMNYLGAEIEIDIGNEHERHYVNKPSVLVCPPGMPHGPFVSQWVDRPFGFFSINLSGEPNMKFID
jgi:hypothetical protein